MTADSGENNISYLKVYNIDTGIAFFIGVKSVLALSDDEMQVFARSFIDGGDFDWPTGPRNLNKFTKLCVQL